MCLCMYVCLCVCVCKRKHTLCPYGQTALAIMRNKCATGRPPVLAVEFGWKEYYMNVSVRIYMIVYLIEESKECSTNERLLYGSLWWWCVCVCCLLFLYISTYFFKDRITWPATMHNAMCQPGMCCSVLFSSSNVWPVLFSVLVFFLDFVIYFLIHFRGRLFIDLSQIWMLLLCSYSKTQWTNRRSKK